jgi:hypothetical protein
MRTHRQPNPHLSLLFVYRQKHVQLVLVSLNLKARLLQRGEFLSLLGLSFQFLLPLLRFALLLTLSRLHRAECSFPAHVDSLQGKH